MKPSDVPWTGATGSPFAAADAPIATDRRLTVKWLGTAGYELRAQGTTLLIDPYLTRYGLWTLLSRRKHGPDVDAIDKHITDADAVLVGHSHFDHVLDVPTIAVKTGAHVYGSESTANLCLASGLPQTQVTAVARGGQTFEVGPFRVRAVPSEHSRFLFGKVPYPGDIPCSCELPMSSNHYKCGQVLSWHIEVGGVRFYHAGSANLIDDAVQFKELDVLMMCTAGRQATDAFIERIIKQTRPNRVLPMHYDNFFQPLDSAMKVLPRTQFGRLVDDVRAVDSTLDVQTLDLSQTVALETKS